MTIILLVVGGGTGQDGKGLWSDQIMYVHIAWSLVVVIYGFEGSLSHPQRQMNLELVSLLSDFHETLSLGADQMLQDISRYNYQPVKAMRRVM